MCLSISSRAVAAKGHANGQRKRSDGARRAPSRRWPRDTICTVATDENLRVSQSTGHESEVGSDSSDHIQLSRRAALLGASSLMAAAPALAASPPPREQFCGITNGSVPGWAFKTDFDQFFIEAGGDSTYVRTVGSPPSKPLLPFMASAPPKVPLVVLHGGPGLSSVYMESLELLAAEGRQIIFYDQVGCGISKPSSSGVSMYDLDLLIRQLADVRQELGTKNGIHLLGHGWGSILALEACTRPGGCDGVASLTLLSPSSSMAALVGDRRATLQRLSSKADQEAILDLDSQGKAAPWEPVMRPYVSEAINRTSRGCLSMAGGKASYSVYGALQGAAYFSNEGPLASWDVTDRLSTITVPTLVVRGEFDEVSERSAAVVRKGIPGAVAIECLGSGSCSHLDNPETLLKEVNDHMDLADGSGTPEA